MNNLLYNAISNISDEFIAEACDFGTEVAPEKQAKKQSRKRLVVFGWAAACACAAAVAVGVSLATVWANGSAGKNGGGDASSSPSVPDHPQDPAHIYGLGSTQSSSVLGTISYTQRTEYSVTFELEITTNPYDYEIYVSILGFMPIYVYGDDGSLVSQYTKNYIITTDPDYYAYGDRTLLEGVLAVTVNGVSSPNGYIPNEVGVYEVVLDYSALQEIEGQIITDVFCVWFWEFYIWG